jgi:hypothetical protein
MTNPKPLIAMAAAFLALIVGLRIDERLAKNAAQSARAAALPRVAESYARLDACLVSSDTPARKPSVQIRRRVRALGPEASRAWLARCAAYANELETGAHTNTSDSELARVETFARGIARALSEGREPLGFDGLAEIIKTMHLTSVRANVEGPPPATFAFDGATLPPVVPGASRVLDVSADTLALRAGDETLGCVVGRGTLDCSGPPRTPRVLASLVERTRTPDGTRWSRTPRELAGLVVGAPKPRSSSAPIVAFAYPESGAPVELLAVTPRTVAFESCVFGERRALRFVGDPVPPADETNLDTLFFFDESNALVGKARLHVGFDRVRLDCSESGAELLYAKDASTRGGPATFEVHRVRCSPEGCRDESALIPRLDERPLVVALGEQVLLLRRSSASGGLVLRIAPLTGLASATERVVVDDAADGGFAVEGLRAIRVPGGVGVVFRSQAGLHGVFVREEDGAVVPLQRRDSSATDSAP